MTTDLKLGLVVGVGVVMTVALIYYPKSIPGGVATSVIPSLPTAARVEMTSSRDSPHASAASLSTPSER